jgi:ERCC4-type nuclease
MRRIVVDTREQKPYDFENSLRCALPAGDYSLEGLEHCIAIERKSMDDLVHTLLAGKCRFRVELEKLQAYDYACIVVEGSLTDVLAGSYRSQVRPESLLGMICAVQLEYQPVHVVFCGDRPHAVAYVSELLKLIDHRYPSTEMEPELGLKER